MLGPNHIRQQCKTAHPKTLHHLVTVDAELLGVTSSELTDGEGPAVETGTEGNSTLVWVNLDVTKSLVEVGGDDDVDGLDGTGEGLVKILLRNLQLQESTINLVDDDNRLDTLTKSLSQDGLGLHAHTLNGVNDNERTIGDTERGGNLGREINVTGRVDQVNQEVETLGLLANNVLDVVLALEGTIQGDSGGLDGDTTLLLIGTGVGGAGISSLSRGNDTGLGEKGVGEGGLSVIDVGNDGHVTDVGWLVHQLADFLNGEAGAREVSAKLYYTISHVAHMLNNTKLECFADPGHRGYSLNHDGGWCFEKRRSVGL